MEDTLIELLESFNYPVFRQGNMSDEDVYPDIFFTFWNTGSPDHSHYDNDEYGTVWGYTVNVYSNNPAATYSTLKDAISLLKKNGFIVPSKGYDVASDEITHTGRGVDIYYLEV